MEWCCDVNIIYWIHCIYLYSIMKEKSLTTVWNETEKLHYAEYQEGNSLYKIWIEDTDSCSARMDLIEQYGLSGIACWSGGYETPEIWNLIEKRLK